MRIKHWQGYGSVEAKKLDRTVDENGIVTVKIRVTGDHEWGLETKDEHTVKDWLLKRMDKKFPENGRIEYESHDRMVDGHEVCTYIIWYKEE
jgi:hypothetical protein